MKVIKLGGNALASANGMGWLESIVSAYSHDHEIVLVHGGGPQIDEEFRIHQLPKNVVAGYRVTDSKSFDVVEMVLAGKVQQSLVRSMRSLSLPAVGITGNDGGLFEARRKSAPDGTDLGQVGEVVRVDVRVITSLLDAGFLPVVSPVSSDRAGSGFNVNADLAAGALAGALNADDAIFMTDVPGIYRKYPDPASLIMATNLHEMKTLLPSLSEGMVPKAEAVILALESGAKRAHVIDGRDGRALDALLAGSLVGTVIEND